MASKTVAKEDERENTPNNTMCRWQSTIRFLFAKLTCRWCGHGKDLDSEVWVSGRDRQEWCQTEAKLKKGTRLIYDEPNWRWCWRWLIRSDFSVYLLSDHLVWLLRVTWISLSGFSCHFTNLSFKAKTSSKHVLKKICALSLVMKLCG